MLLIYNFLKKNLKGMGYASLAALMLLSFSYTDLSSTLFFKANTLLSVKHAPFDGLVYPYKYAADWVNLNGTDREMAYNEIPGNKLLNPMKYNAFELAKPLDSLGFSNSEDLRIRNEKITYAVPYLGNYNLDGLEGGGSHPAVDIKLPMRTPILAIGNGVVTKVDYKAGGFGHHIVIRHNEFPDFQNPGKTTTYFSSYSHMDTASVAVGSVVVRGQQIGLSGKSGTASTPHLHFQIDKIDAPWNPYWPFTTAEADAAGLDFFEAINSGLGKDNGAKYTINPLLYVQAHLNTVGNNIAVVSPPVVVDAPVMPTVPVVNTENQILKPTVPAADPTVQLAADFKVEVPDIMVLGSTYNVKLKYNKSDNTLAALNSDNFEFRSNLIADYSVPKFLDMSLGELNIPFEPQELGNMNLTVKTGDVRVSSKNVQVRLFSDLENEDADLKSIKYLRDKGIVKGYEDMSFNPNGVVNKAEAAKLIVESLPSGLVNNVSRSKLKFADVSPDDWYYEDVQVLVGLGAVEADREFFEPSKKINLAEYLKLLYTALQVDLNPNVHETYSNYFDVNAWYAPFLQLAMKQSSIESADAVHVADGLQRRDVARIMTQVLKEIEKN